MEELVKILPNFKKFNNYVEDVKNGITPIMLSGLTDTAKAHFAYSTFFYIEKPICIITYNEIQAKKIIKDLSYFTQNIDFFPKKEILAYSHLAESKDNEFLRTSCLNRIYEKKAKVVVTTIEAVEQKTISKQSINQNLIHLKTGEKIDLEEIKVKLVTFGYERCEIAQNRYSFCIRGGIVDIAISDTKGVRVELWGDEIDSIRYFDVSSQRSIENTNNIKIYPALEYEEEATLIDYIKDDYIIFLDEIGKIKARAENIAKDNNNLTKSLIEKDKEVPKNLITQDSFIKFLEGIKSTQTIYLEKQDIGFVDKQSMHAKRNGYSFGYREVNFFRSSVDLLLQEVEQAINAKKTVVILTGSRENSKKFSNLLQNKNIIISDAEISSGFECYDFNLLVISGKEIFEVHKKRYINKTEFKQAETIIFADLKIGDYIVHKTNGIGQFIGVNTIKADGIVKDYIKIRYRDDDILYIPTNSLDNVRKYIGAGDRAPKVSRLGTKEWENTKQKVKSNLREIAKDLIELYGRREKIKGFSFTKDTPWQKEFDDSFEYVETDDQLRAIKELKQDMENEKPMDRLLCGDVGYGKTEVAIRGAFKACMDQKQVAYLVPTTILAQQQYEAFKSRMKEYPIEIELLNRFKSKKEQEKIIKRLKLGEIDIIIGTHRLLSEDVAFKDLGFLIVDEEHRFGVKDKEKIKKIKTNVDVLTMTATPIPRTLHMSIVGIRDMSCLYEPPHDRIPVQTYVLEYDEEVVKEAITKELEREGQAFYLYNRVENIQRKATELANLVPEAKIAVAHGKMSGTQLEDIMVDFINKKIDVLVCTTILESGIDIQNANTIIVENSDRLGLSQLYQIRGRVGRANKQAYAYMTYKKDKVMSEASEKRLKAIKEFTEFGSGFKIAMRDLEIRGAGSLLGELQHGHMDVVGYDMYCKLLDEVIKEERNGNTYNIGTNGVGAGLCARPTEDNDIDVLIDINVSSYIPNEYIEDTNQKIEVYQNIACIREKEDIQSITDELTDRYGKIPKEVLSLLDISYIKQLCKSAGITKVSQNRENIVFTFEPDLFTLDINDLIKKYKERVKFSSSIKPYITYQLQGDNIIQEIKEFLLN